MLQTRFLLPAVILAATVSPTVAAEITPSVKKRFQAATGTETPDFRRHMVPLLGKLGCNGRACHGSFQGRGGFRLSLFGYDFKADHEQMTAGDKPRVNLKNADLSLVIRKPTSDLIHEGGKRYSKGSWEHHVFKRWIAGGAKSATGKQSDFRGLDVYPKELLFSGKGQKRQLKVIAKWADGTKEDVTTICRFKSNDTTVANIDEEGLVTSGGAGDTHVVVSYDNGVVPIPVIRPVSDRVGSNYPNVPIPTQIDKHVVSKLRKLGIVPSELSSDAEFLRRVSLDLTGTLPSPKEVKAFLADKSSNKRAKKIDELLKSPAYSAWWTTKLCDYTGNNSDGLNNVLPVRGRASQDWYDWIYKRVNNNTSYDKIVEGIVTATSREKGESYEEYCKNMSAIYKNSPTKKFADRSTMPYYWARRNFRQPEERAIGFAYTFLGIRIQCAQCHKHPFDRWTKDDFAQFTGFFGSVTAGTRDRKEYQQMIDKLGIKGKRGNQVRRELGKYLQQGKTVPFQEVYVGRNRRRRGGANNAQIRTLRRQIRTITQKLNAAKKSKSKDKIKQFTEQLAKINKKVRALQQRARRNSRNQEPSAKLLGGDVITLKQGEDARVDLMKWLRDPSHGMLARAFVNRVWSTYFNVGIISPPDDLSLANPPSNKPLLDYLTAGFIKSNYDMKWLHREILNSRTYQLTWKPNATNKNDERNFSRAVPRRLPAEVVYDALQQATGSDKYHASLKTDLDGRAISIAAAGRRYRNNRGTAYAMQVFGRSTRESNCDCDRSEEASLLQTVYLQNDQDVHAMITRAREGWVREVANELGVKPPTAVSRPNSGRRRRSSTNNKATRKLRQQLSKLYKQIKQARTKGDKKTVAKLSRQASSLRKRLAKTTGQSSTANRGNNNSGGEKAAKVDAEKIVKEAYLRTLSRYPNAVELKRASQYINDSKTTINGVRDVLWALINTKEFIVNH